MHFYTAGLKVDRNNLQVVPDIQHALLYIDRARVKVRRYDLQGAPDIHYVIDYIMLLWMGICKHIIG